MSDNTQLNPGIGGDAIRDLNRLGTGVKTQVVQLDFGGDAGNAESLASVSNPLPVVLPSAQISQLIPLASVAISNLPTLQAVALTTAQVAAIAPLSIQPISATTLPLPAGAATSSDIATVVTALGTPLQSGGTVALTTAQVAALAPLATQPISAAALPLPAGAATAAGVAAVVTALGAPLQAGGTVALDNASLIALETVQSNIQVNGAPIIPANPISIQPAAAYFVFSSGNSSVSQLAAGTTFTGAIESTLNQPALSLIIESDQPLTLTLNQYISPSDYQPANSSSFAITANMGYNQAVTLNGDYFNLVVTNNGASATTKLKIDTYYGTIAAVGQAPMNLSAPVVIANNQTAIPISVSALPLPSGASTDQTLKAVLAAIGTLAQASGTTAEQKLVELLSISQSTSSDDQFNTRTLLDILDPIGEQFVPLGVSPAGIDKTGQQPAAQSFPVTLAQEQTQDFWTGVFTLNSSQPSILTWNVLSPTGAPLDVLAYRSASVQVVAGAGVTPSAFTFEGSNDLINWQAITGVYSNTGTASSAVPVTSLTITANNSISCYIPLTHRWLRVRLSTAITPSGTFLSVSARLSMVSYAFPVTSVNTAFISGSAINNGGAGGSQSVTGPIIAGTANTTAYPVRVGGTDQNNVIRYILTDQTGALAAQQEPTNLAQSGSPEVLNQILAQLKVLTIYMRELSSALNAGVPIADDEAAILSDPTLFN